MTLSGTWGLQFGVLITMCKLQSTKKHSLIYKPKTNPTVKWATWGMACPANNDPEREFAGENSFYRERALFMQRSFNEKTIHTDNVDDTKTDICDHEAFKLSMLIGENGMTLEFGYEIYYTSFGHSAIRETIYNEYLPLSFMTGSLTAWKNGELCSVIKNCFTVKNVDLLLDNKEHMKFLWIPLFKVWYPVGHYEFRKIVYEIHRNNIDATLQCEDYSLGQELFEFHQHTKTGHSLYSKDHQMVVLGGLKLPPPEAEGACEPEYECLMKWQLIPADQFQFGYSESLSCSNLTTVPLWRSTLEGIMKKLDHYLYTLSRVSGKPLRITAGMTGVLQLQNDSWIWGSNRDIYLNEETKLRVPKIIYKVVKFESNQCKGDAKSCWYGIVIVIHNGPYFVEKNRICEQDKSGELGWEEIRYETWSYEGPQSKFIYVCSISAGIFSKLGLTFKKDVPVQDLSLLRFPYLDENNQPSWKNMKKEVFRELDRLSKTDEKLRLDDNEIIERPSIDSDKYVKSQEKSTDTNSNDNGGDIENDRQKTE